MAGWSSYQLYYDAAYELKMRRMKKMCVAHEAELYAWEVEGSAERDAHEAELAAQSAEWADVVAALVARCCMLRAQTANAERELSLFMHARGRVQEDVLGSKLAAREADVVAKLAAREADVSARESRLVGWRAKLAAQAAEIDLHMRRAM